MQRKETIMDFVSSVIPFSRICRFLLLVN